MADIYCKQCGEPWEAESLRDGTFAPKERRAFLAGKGCPACHFGAHCTQCSGTGKERQDGILARIAGNDCGACRGNRTLLVRRLRGRGWTRGFIPHVQPFPGEPKILEDYGWSACLEGSFREVLAECPFCVAEPCHACNGSGELQRREEDVERFYSSLCEALE